MCEREVNANELYYSDIEGLRGLPTCIYHGDLGTRPSYSDLRGIDDTLVEAVNAAVREQPFGDEVWWNAAALGGILREDSGYLLREGVDGVDTFDGFLHEA